MFKTNLISNEEISIGQYTYKLIIFESFYGKFGYNSEIYHQTTKSNTHSQSKDEANLRGFIVAFYVPLDPQLGNLYSNRGFVFFESYGNYGATTETVSKINGHFRNQLSLRTTLHLRVVSSEIFWNEFIEKHEILQIDFIEHSKYTDKANAIVKDQYLYKESTKTIKGINKKSQLFRKLIQKFEKVSNNNDSFVEFENKEYKNAKMKVKIDNRTKTLNMNHIDNWSVSIPIKEEVLDRGNNLINYNIIIDELNEIVDYYSQNTNIVGEYDD